MNKPVSTHHPLHNACSRRGFLRGAAQLAGAGALAWVPAFRIAADAANPPPPDFPPGIPLYKQAFENWSTEIVVDDLWTCTPGSPQDVVTLANWCLSHGYRLRARGMMHSWAPLTVPAGGAPNVLLADTTQCLTAVSIDTAASTVTAQAGVTLDVLLQKLQDAGLGISAMPAVGTITLGGALAIDAHGSALPAVGETLPPGQTLGSLSNRVLGLTAVVWDATQNAYALRSFTRTDAECGALMTHLGRAFITEATLRVGANQRMRCQSYTGITADELFAAAGSSGRTMAHFTDQAGRVEAIWFPFTTKPWLKVWSLAPRQPLLSRPVVTPYNYPFSDVIPLQVAQLAEEIVAGNPEAAPLLGQTQYDVSVAGLAATLSQDIWGWSKDVLLYILPSTLRLTENGHAILTNRANLQRTINEFVTRFSAQLAAYQAQGKYPINGAVEIRACSLDNPADCGVPGAGAPLLSALRPRPDHPEWDTAVWLNCLSIPGTPYLNDFNRELEQWIYGNYTGSYAAVRAEWSKGWAYGATAGWSDPLMLGSVIPNSFRTGQPAATNWDAAVSLLDQLDPYRLYSAPLQDQLLP